jgi:hypothetical protein
MACIEVFKAYGDDQYVDKTLQVWTKIQSGQVNARDSSSNDPLTCNGSECVWHRFCSLLTFDEASIVGAMSDAGVRYTCTTRGSAHLCFDSQLQPTPIQNGQSMAQLPGERPWTPLMHPIGLMPLQRVSIVHTPIGSIEHHD